MLLKAHMDAPGVLHYVNCRRFERRSTFRDDTDGKRFVDRLANLLIETAILCYDRALIGNWGGI